MKKFFYTGMVFAVSALPAFAAEGDLSVTFDMTQVTAVASALLVALGAM